MKWLAQVAAMDTFFERIDFDILLRMGLGLELML